MYKIHFGFTLNKEIKCPRQVKNEKEKLKSSYKTENRNIEERISRCMFDNQGNVSTAHFRSIHVIIK